MTLAIICSPSHSAAQLVISQTQTPAQLVQNALLGPGVFPSNVIYNGQPGTVMPALQSSAERIARFNGTASNIGLNAGVILTSGMVQTAVGPNNDPFADGGSQTLVGDPDLHILTGYGWPFNQVPDFTRDVAVLEFDFIPISDMVTFRYVFASEEYPTSVCQVYNDAFGFFLSGPGISGPFTNNAINLALIPGSLTQVSINTVNGGMIPQNANGPVMDPFGGCFATDSAWASNTAYFIYNGSGLPFDAPYCCDPSYVQYNGFTTVLTATAAVQCGQQYHIKLAIGDAENHSDPSAVFLEQGSFMSTERFGMSGRPGPTVEITATDTLFIENDCDSVYLRFHRLGGLYLDEDLTIVASGSATAGEDYLPPLPTSVHFNPLDTLVEVAIAVPVDADGLEELIVTLLTCNGLQQQVYRFLIDQRPPLEVDLEDLEAFCPGGFTLTPEVSGGSNDPLNWTYLWSTGATTPSIVVQVEENTQYWVTVSDSCWTASVTDSAWVLIPDHVPMVLDVSSDTAIACLGFADVGVVASGGAGGYTYVWTSNGTVLGTTDSITVPASLGTVYVVEVTDQCGQVALDSLTVTTGPTPPLVITAVGDTVMCAGMPMVLQVVSVSGGGGSYSYEWSIPSGGAPNTSQSVQVMVDDDSYFTVTVRDECGNVADTTLAAIVQDFDPMVITLYGDTIVCPGETVVLWVEVQGGAGGYSVEWPMLGDGDSVEWVAGGGGILAAVEVTDACGTLVRGSIDVGVHDASVSIDATQHSDTDWTFEAITVPDDVEDVEWDLGDGTSATGTLVSHTYTDPNAYWVVVYMTTPEGCVAVDSVRTRPPSGAIYFPNAFSPNGDEINDTFGGSGALIDNYELLIFDRWGRVMFESSDMNLRWNGRSSDGEEVMDGVYPYRYRVSGLKLPMKQGFGHVTLLR